VENVILDTWARTLDKVKEQIGAQRFELWFKHTELLTCGPDLVEVGVPNLFVAEWLQTHFGGLIAGLLKEELGAEPPVKFKTSPRLFHEASHRQRVESAAPVGGTPPEALSGTGPRPRRDMTLANFVVGPGSRLAHACALEVVALSHSRYNPLFLYSACGLGKTHLLNGIWNGIQEHEDGRLVEYLSAEVFTNEFVQAMKHHRLEAFRERYRGADVLLIDDVHFFNGKSGLQEELLHTFDALHRHHRQIVLASDTHPRKMASFRRNLINRFISGMVVCIEPPDADTRYRILVAKAAKMGCRVAEEVLRFLGQNVPGNVRDLEGALTGLVAYARLCNRAPDLSMARETLRNLHFDQGRAVGLPGIEKAVCEIFGVSKKALHSGSRTRRISLPRQVCMTLARRLTPLSCAEIAAYFGNKHHSSVRFAERSVRNRSEADADFRARVEEAERLVRPT